MAVSIVYNKIVEREDTDRDVKPFTDMQDEACRILTYWPEQAPASQPAKAE